MHCCQWWRGEAALHKQLRMRAAGRMQRHAGRQAAACPAASRKLMGPPQQSRAGTRRQAGSCVGRQNRPSSRAANQYEADDGHRRDRDLWATWPGWPRASPVPIVTLDLFIDQLLKDRLDFKILHLKISHQIFGHMYGVLNKIYLQTFLHRWVVNHEMNLMSLLNLYFATLMLQ